MIRCAEQYEVVSGSMLYRSGSKGFSIVDKTKQSRNMLIQWL